MCGIVCGDYPATKEQIQLSLDKLRPRGPDNQSFVEPVRGVFMGHTLLSVFSDAVTSIQPIWSNDSTVVGCVNGEIYNYRELRSQLEEKGYKFATTSDSEVVIHGLHWLGKEFINLLDGEFCFVSYNTQTRTWICGTDVHGTKPLRYFLKNGSFAAASTVSALSALGIPIALSPSSCRFSFASQCLPYGETLFTDIYTLPPASVLTVNKSSAKVHRYSLSIKGNAELDIEYLENLLEEAILRRAHPLGTAVALSSGIDSSTIAYYLNKNNLSPRCYSIDFVGSSYSEATDIRSFSERHDIETTYVDVTPSQIRKMFPQAVLNCENMSINPHAVGKFILNQRMVSDGHRVCLTGDGSDELFYGYSHFHDANEYQFIENSKSIGSQFIPLVNGAIDLDCILNEADMLSSQELYYRYWLSEYGLKILGDSQSASSSQEHRYPFLDKTLVNYVSRISMFKNLNAPSKNILRMIVSQWDSSLAAMPKRPFTSPTITADWMQLFEEYVFENNKLFDTGLLDRTRIIEYSNRLITNETHSKALLTQVLSLGILSHGICDG